IDGSKEIDERVLSHLKGYRGIGPVRIGNLAYRQTQHDVFGEVIAAAYELFRVDKKLGRNLPKLIEYIANRISTIWTEPDHGLWEIRGEKRHYTYSKLMCWVGLRCATQMYDDNVISGRIDEWRIAQEEIQEYVLNHMYNEKI